MYIDIMTEQLVRVDREMEESRRQREMLQLDLDSRSNGDTVSDESEVGLDGEVERLRQQIEALSRRMVGLEAERQEVEAPPPDYYSFTPRQQLRADMTSRYSFTP